MKEKLQSVKNNKSSFKIVMTVLFAALIIWGSGSLIKNSADISRLNSQLNECNAQYEQQIQDNQKIKAILNSDDKDNYIEQKAREKGYVKDGEVVFYDISSSK